MLSREVYFIEPMSSQHNLTQVSLTQLQSMLCCNYHVIIYYLLLNLPKNALEQTFQVLMWLCYCGSINLNILPLT